MKRFLGYSWFQSVFWHCFTTKLLVTTFLCSTSTRKFRRNWRGGIANLCSCSIFSLCLPTLSSFCISDQSMVKSSQVAYIKALFRSVALSASSWLSVSSFNPRNDVSPEHVVRSRPNLLVNDSESCFLGILYPSIVFQKSSSQENVPCKCAMYVINTLFTSQNTTFLCAQAVERWVLLFCWTHSHSNCRATRMEFYSATFTPNATTLEWVAYLSQWYVTVHITLIINRVICVHMGLGCKALSPRIAMILYLVNQRS